MARTVGALAAAAAVLAEEDVARVAVEAGDDVAAAAALRQSET